jgi:hypothetical protein
LKRVLVRVLGIVLIAAGVAGLVFSVAGLIILDGLEEQVESTISNQLEVVDRALAATEVGLGSADYALEQASLAGSALEQAVMGMSQAVDDTLPTLDTVGWILGEQLPDAIRATQTTLSTISETAQIVDDFLTVVTTVPFLGIDRYEPDTPLAEGVNEVIASLNGIPLTLAQAQQDLVAAGDGLEALRDDVSAMTDGVVQMSSSLEEARTALDEYRSVVAQLQDLSANLQTNLGTWLRWVRIGLSLILVWLGVAQIGLITQGWELVVRSRAQ